MPKIVQLSPYQQHRKKWLNCTRCPLCKTRKNVVLVRGNLPCDVLMVGEAPGTSEDTLGVPFVGPAGKLLDRAIEDAGGNVPRIRLAFTNVIACIPLDEDGRKVSEVKDWPKEAVKKCEPRLRELVRLAQPVHIVVVGQVAKKSIIGASQFRLDGEDEQPEWIPQDQFMGFTEVIHPAAILRANPAQQGLMYQRTVVALREVFESLIPF